MRGHRGRGALVAVGLVATGCLGWGLACVGDASTQPQPDASADAPAAETGVDAAKDAAVEAGPACDKTKPFQTPVAVLAAPGISEDGFWLSSDQRTAYASIAFLDAGPGGYDLFTLSRGTTSSPWGAPVPLALDTAAMERGGVVRGDGLELFFGRLVSGQYEIMVSTRTSTAVDFPTPSPSTLNTPQDDYPQWISPDGKVIYLSSSRPGTLGASDIYRAERGDLQSPFGAAVAVASLNTTSIESGAVLTPDELEIYISSNRPGGPGGQDIYRATRSTKNDGFGTPTLVTELNSSVIDAPVWLSADGCTLYFQTAEKDGGGVTYDVYMASRPK